MRRVARTESADESALKPGDPVWLYEFENGRRCEHIARVEKANADGTLELSYQVTGEIGRNKMSNVPPLRSDSQGSAWQRAK